jgi:hypothetical protein
MDILVQKGEDFTNGITPIDADILLANDIEKAKNQLKTLNLGVLPRDIEDYLVIMLFQLGLSGVQKFKNYLQQQRHMIVLVFVVSQ